MNTRKALKAYTKGESQDLGHVAGPLAKYAKKFMLAYDEKERAIIARKNQDQIVQPVLDVLRQRVANKLGEPELAMPIAMKFDTFQVVKNAAEREPNDKGLSRLAKHLESVWTKDPMGSITLGEVMKLRAHYTDSYPKSKVAKVLDKELPKVGYAQLPVAKLAKIAAGIRDQDEFDNAIVANGLDGDAPRSVQARTLVRELVALRGANLKVGQVEDADDRSNMERVADRIQREAQHGLPPDLMKDDGRCKNCGESLDGWTGPLCDGCSDSRDQGGEHYDDTFDRMELGARKAQMGPHSHPAPMGPPGSHVDEDPLADPLADPLDIEEPGLDLGMEELDGPPMGEGPAEAEDLSQQVQEFTQNEVAPQLPGIQEYNEVEREEGGSGPVDDPIDWAFQEGQEMGEDGEPAHSVSPSKPGWVDEELSEHGKGPAAGPGPVEVEVDNLEGLEDDVENIVMARAANKLQIIAKAPPGYGKWVEHRKEEGMDPEMAFATAWAKHNRGEQPTKKAQWTPDEMAELDALSPDEGLGLGGKCRQCGESSHPDFEPFCSQQCAVDSNLNQAKPGMHPDSKPSGAPHSKRHLERMRGRGQSRDMFNSTEYQPSEEAYVERWASGLDAPKPKNHPKVTSYAPDRTKDGGAELTKDETKKAMLTAAEVESALLDRGETVKVGNVSIGINGNDEIELWVKDAGRACDLRDIDIAIADFLKYASVASKPQPKKSAGQFAILTMQPVPCGKCATVSYFKPSANPQDLFECDCGHRTKNATIMSLVKHGQLNRVYNLNVGLPASATKDKAQVKNAVAYIMKNLIGKHAAAAVEHYQKGVVSIRVDNADTAKMAGIADSLKKAGFAHVAQLSGGPIPGGADMPVAEPPKDKVPAGKPAGGAAAPAAAPGEQSGMSVSINAPNLAQSLAHYKSKGVTPVDAFDQLKKDFPEFYENHIKQDQQAAVDLFKTILDMWAQPTTPAGAPAGAPADPGAPPVEGAPGAAPAMPMQAQKAKMDPEIRKPKDHVSVGKKPLGTETDSDHPGSLKQPKIVKKHPAKQKSPTDMGKHMDDKDPGSFGAEKPPKDGKRPGAGDAKGTKAPSTGMHGKDSDNDPAKSIPVPKVNKPRSS